MNIRLDIKNKKILNSKNKEIEFNKENLEKVMLQNSYMYLNNDMSWNVNFDQALSILRKKRDEKLRETDYIFLSDTTKINTTDYKNNLKIERQKLRDITEGLESLEDILKAYKKI